MSPSGSQPSQSDTEELWSSGTQNNQLSKDLRSDPVLWTLVVSRRSENESDDLQKDGCLTKASPFNLETITRERTRHPQLEDDKSPDPASQNVIEIITSVYDPRRRITGRLGTFPSRRLNKRLHSCLILGQSVVLHSSLIRKFLQSTIEYYPAHPRSDFDDVVTIDEPFAVLIHHFPKIEEYIELENTHEAAQDLVRAHLMILREFLKPRYGDIQKSVQISIAPKAISFELLWYILRPGQDVYIVTDGEPYVCVIESVSGQKKKATKPFKEVKGWHIQMWYLDTADGLTMGRRRSHRYINNFSGMREMISLPVCLVSVWDALDDGARRARVLRRNSMYLEGLQKNQDGHMHCVYDGPDIGDGRRHHGKVVIDHQNSETHVTPDFLPPDQYTKFAKYDNIYLRNQPPKIPKLRRTYEWGFANARKGVERWGSDVADAAAGFPTRAQRAERSMIGRFSSSSSSENLQPGLLGTQFEEESFVKQRYGCTEITDHQKLVMWPQAPAFALSSKQWMTISLGHVQRIEPSDDSIKNLQLDPAAVQIIKALSMQQDQSGDSWGADFIEGKGAGQIVLLHGPPGVGKTYTVEGISEWLRRPLISLTVADIGTTETRVEQELMKWFDLAEAWNAVLLVDEADIFLEQRKNRDLSRNGLVSAFLRRMEYFRGLLFLTTNRVGQIDDAFVSRVHMAIGYERLSPDFRRNIWEGFFRKLERERAGKILVGPSAKKFVLHSDEVQKIELNGREIRNALQTAITLAEFESIEAAGASGESGTTSASSQLVVVEEDHFRRVLKMSEKFHDYVTAIRREDEIQRAKVRGDRDDYAKAGAADDRFK